LAQQAATRTQQEPAVRAVAQSLAQFFPGAVPLRLPVQVCAGGVEEQTVIEFGTANEVMFASTLPLEFSERVTITNSDSSLTATAEIVALQLCEGRAAVAARFVEPVANWIVKA
jgi:hypothetical protein